MARWSVAGSLASLAGPLVVAGGFALGWSWRWVFFALAGVLLVLAGEGGLVGATTSLVGHRPRAGTP